jgi:hypothetical protein
MTDEIANNPVWIITEILALAAELRHADEINYVVHDWNKTTRLTADQIDVICVALKMMVGEL